MRTLFIKKKIEGFIYVIEIIIVVLLGVGIIIGLVDLAKYFSEILVADPADSYDFFQAFLGHALVLIVGVELILMILYHSTKAILELVLFVIARKMLIYSNTMLDLVFGTFAIAIVFIILKYLVQNDKEKILRRRDITYSASANIEDILSQTGFDLPTDRGRTVGSLVCSLAKEEGRPIEENEEFYVENIKIKITKTREDGIIEEVVIADNKEGNIREPLT